MGLVTLILLLVFTAVYLSKSLDKKPEFLTKAVEKISSNLDKVSLWGAGYGLIGAVLTLIMIYNPSDMLVRLIGNLMIVLMALPFIFEQFHLKLQEKLNPAIFEETKNVANWVIKQEKYIGYAGAVASLFLFAVLFR